MHNFVQLIGHLGADPEMRRTQDGRPVANIRMATSESWKDKDSGERHEQTEWHRVTCFNENLCKVIEQYTKKGSKIMVQGKLKTRKWTDQNDIERFSTEIVLQGFDCKLLLLDGKEKGPAAGPEDYGTTRTRGGESKPAEGGEGGEQYTRDLDDEIPF